MHWSEAVAKILKEPTGDLKALSSVAGADWRTLFRYQSLAGCDLRGQDLTGMDLTGCDLDQAILDERTAIDAEFDPRSDIKTGYYQISIPGLLNDAILNFSDHKNYVYTAWAYKALIERFCKLSRYNSIDEFEAKLHTNPDVRSLALSKSGQKTLAVTVLVYSDQIIAIDRIKRQFPEYNEFSFAFLCGLLLYRFKLIRRIKIDGLSLNSIWPSIADADG